MRLISFIFLLFFYSNQSQVRKSIEAYRFETPPEIDGKLNESEWKNINAADGFTLMKPETRYGEKIPSDYETKAFLGYDDKAIYLGAQLNHPDPENIPKEFGRRDWGVFGKSEAFSISLDTFDDRFNSFGFVVSSAGIIADLYRSGDFGYSSLNYDTVFDAKVHINDQGWSLEMIIPYSAIRFPKKDIQKWGINFVRKIVDLDNSEFSWNPVDENLFEYQESMGLLTNIKNINPPLRLFLYPYLQTAVNSQKGLKSSSSYSAGLDLKYGINNSFTLDLTLIPDFGQVSFDDTELNLSPFEQQFTERRPFFTEGADLFKKADERNGKFFYSRRIGQKINFNESDYLNEGEELIRYDEKSDLINSVKITGTTDGKLSVGFLNAFTANAYAFIKTTLNKTRKELLSPSTNYNVISLSQELLNDYSSISFLNTNVNRSSGLNANNSVIVFDLYDNKRNFNLKSSLFRSYAPRFSEKNGFRGSINLEELRGNFLFGLNWNGVDKYYSQNELGFYNYNNDQNYQARIRYRLINENKTFISYSTYLFFNQTFRFDNFFKSGGGWRFGNDFETQNRTKFEADFYYRMSSRDFYEPRVENRYVNESPNFGFKIGFDTNYTNTFSYGIEYERSDFYNGQFDENKNNERFRFNAQYRISEKIKLRASSQTEKNLDDIGFLKINNENIYFGIRDIKSFENSIEFDFSIDNSKFISLRLRNFWSSANYDKVLFNLLYNGNREITDYSLLDFDPNTNFNLWNLDLKFEWWFYPGSTISINYKNQIFNRNNQSALDYYKSLKNLFELPIEHQLSLRINYLIDTNRFKKKINN